MRAQELKRPEFVMVMGGAGSGKNHYIETHYPNHQLVDVDQLKQNVNLGSAVKNILPLLKDYFSKKFNVVHPTLGLQLKGQENKIKAAKESNNGYKVILIFIDTPVETAIKRVAHRVGQGGHDINQGKIEFSNKQSRETFNTLRLLPEVDQSFVVQNP